MGRVPITPFWSREGSSMNLKLKKSIQDSLSPSMSRVEDSSHTGRRQEVSSTGGVGVIG